MVDTEGREVELYFAVNSFCAAISLWMKGGSEGGFDAKYATDFSK